MSLTFEWIPILGLILSFVLVRHALDAKQKSEAERRRLLEKAIDSGADRNAIEAIVHQLGGKLPPAPAARPSRFLALLLALGWLTLFSGAGLWVMATLLHATEAEAAGCLVAIIGFGLVTYPFALRELEARRPSDT